MPGRVLCSPKVNDCTEWLQQKWQIAINNKEIIKWFLILYENAFCGSFSFINAFRRNLPFIPFFHDHLHFFLCFFFGWGHLERQRLAILQYQLILDLVSFCVYSSYIYVQLIQIAKTINAVSPKCKRLKIPFSPSFLPEEVLALAWSKSYGHPPQ